MKTSSKLMPPQYLLLALAMIIMVHWTFPLAIVFNGLWQWLGGTLVVAGGLFVVVPARQFETRGTTIKPFQESSTLVVDGLFAISRNPMYLGMMLISIGTWLMLGSVTPLIVLAAFYLILTQNFIQPEELLMEQVFAEQYRDYKTRVRRWI